MKAGVSMTDEEKKKYRDQLIEECKTYNHIDFDDDINIIEIMLDATLEEMTELIPDFDRFNMTARQRLLTLCFVKELYDNREKYTEEKKSLTSAVSSMLLKETLGR